MLLNQRGYPKYSHLDRHLKTASYTNHVLPDPFFSSRACFLMSSSCCGNLRRQFCTIADFHISEIKPWRNCFADQTKAI